MFCSENPTKFKLYQQNEKPTQIQVRNGRARTTATRCSCTKPPPSPADPAVPQAPQQPAALQAQQ